MALTGFATPEDAMTACHEEILHLFQLHPMNIADKLLPKHLVTEEFYEKMFVPDSDINKARQMALNVKRKIQNNPQYFKVFLEVLRSNDAARSLVTKLEESVLMPSISAAEDSSTTKYIDTDPSAATSLSEMSNKLSESVMDTSVGNPQVNSTPSSLNVLPLQQSLQTDIAATRDDTGGVLSKKESICSAIEMLENKFAKLQVTLLLELKAMNVSVDDLVLQISCLPSVNVVYHSWKKIVQKDFRNLNELWTDLNCTVWSILDPYLIEYFIKKFGSEELKKDMKIYSTELIIFKEKTLVSDFISCWKEALSRRAVPDFEKFIIKYDKKISTLADLDEFRKKINIRFHPSLTDCLTLIDFGRLKATESVTSHDGPESTKEDVDEVKNDKKSVPQEIMTEYIESELLKEYPQLPVARQDEVKDFTLPHLTLLKWTDSDGKNHSLRLRDEMSSRWRDVGDLLGVASSRLEGIHTQHMGEVKQCCRSVLLDWLEMEEKSYPASWEGLLVLLKDMQLNNLAKKLNEALDCYKETA